MRRNKIDILVPATPAEMGVMRCQLAIKGPLADAVKVLMLKYDMEQGAVCRMLMADGMEARDGRRVA